MSNVGFRYAMGGMENLSNLAALEQQRRYADWEQQVANSRAQSQAIGGLVGSVIGAGKGLYEDRKEQHDAAEREKVREWEQQREAQRWENARAGRKMDEGVAARPKANPYSALTDLHRQLVEWGWAD